MLGGRDITDVPTAFTEQHSGQLEVIFTTAAPSLEGAVTDHVGKPQTQATVLLFGDDPATWVPHSSYFRRTPLDKDGRFTLTGLREGSYFAVALGPEAGGGLDQPTRCQPPGFSGFETVGSAILIVACHACGQPHSRAGCFPRTNGGMAGRLRPARCGNTW